MKLAYVVYSTPYGFREIFILREMEYVKKAYPDLLVIPLMPSKAIVHEKGKLLQDNVLFLPLINFQMVFFSIRFFLRNARLVVSIINKIFRHSRTLRIALKNLIVLPKSIYVSRILRRQGISQIHVQWGTAPATMGYILSKLTNIPWSLSLRRWDIYENNMLKEKIGSVGFVRCISEKGKTDSAKIVGAEYANKIFVVHSGTEVDSIDIPSIKKRILHVNNGKIFTIATPANLVVVKGHRYLIDACAILVERGATNFQFLFYGEGHLKKDLEKHICNKGLSEFITLCQAIPQEMLLDKYRRGEVDIVVIPSINTEEGEHEGIPNALFEAMSFGIPVISTNTGSIPELLSDDSGIIVKEKSAMELANAINDLIVNKELAIKLAIKGHEKVASEFDISKNAELVLELIRENADGKNI